MGSLATIGSKGLRVSLVFLMSMPVSAEAKKASSGVTITDCPQSITRPLPALLSLELQGVVDIDPTKAPVLLVRCTESRVVASAALGKRKLDRKFKCSELPEFGSDRLLALTLVELRTAVMEKPVRIKKVTPRTQVIVLHAPSPPPKAPSIAVPVKQSIAAGDESGNTLAVFARGRGFADGLWLWGPELQVDMEPCTGCILRWALAGEWSRSQDFRTGEIDSTVFSTAIGFGYGLRRGKWTFSGVGGLRLGHGSFQADPEPGAVGADHQGVWGGTAVNLGAVYAVSPRWAVNLDLEAGYTLWSVRARVEDQDTLALAGPWIAPALGLQFAFDPQ